MKIADLPNFIIKAARLRPDGWTLDGQFNHLTTVREGRSWLYESPEHSVSGDLESLNAEDLTASLKTWESNLSVWVVGSTHTWLDGYYNAHVVTAIADEYHVWESLIFGEQDAFASVTDGWRRLRPAGEGSPEPGESLVRGAWDHEHCMICDTHIDSGDQTYTDSENHWLCESCYRKFAVPNDLSFLRDGP